MCCGRLSEGRLQSLHGQGDRSNVSARGGMGEEGNEYYGGTVCNERATIPKLLLAKTRSSGVVNAARLLPPKLLDASQARTCNTCMQ